MHCIFDSLVKYSQCSSLFVVTMYDQQRAVMTQTNSMRSASIVLKQQRLLQIIISHIIQQLFKMSYVHYA